MMKEETIDQLLFAVYSLTGLLIGSVLGIGVAKLTSAYGFAVALAILGLVTGGALQRGIIQWNG